MGAIGGARCQYHLRQIPVFPDAMVMNKPEFMGGVIQNKVDPQTGEVVDQSTRDHLWPVDGVWGLYQEGEGLSEVRADASPQPSPTGEGANMFIWRR